MAKIPKSIQSWLIPRLRRISMYWPGKQVARDRAKRQVQIGYYKNGKPEYKVMWECAACLELYEKPETQMDHIKPVIDVRGFQNWEDTISTEFCPPENYQCLCKPCHYLKTQVENEERVVHRNKKKSK